MADVEGAFHSITEEVWTARVVAGPNMLCTEGSSPSPVPASPTTPSQPPSQPPPLMLRPEPVLKFSDSGLEMNKFLVALVETRRCYLGVLDNVRTLELDGLHPILCQSLYHEVGDLELPNLQELDIQGAAMRPEILKKLVFNHRYTLRRLRIELTALTIPKDDKLGGYDAWIDVLEIVRQHFSHLEYVEIGHLFWRWEGPSPHGPTKPSSDPHSCLVLPRKKYHLRIQPCEDGREIRWKLEYDGVWAAVQVGDALQAFIDELVKVRNQALEDEEQHI